MNSKLLHKVERIVGEYHNDLTEYHVHHLIEFLERNGFVIDKIKETNEKLQTELMEIGKKIYSQNSENKTNSTSANNSNSDSVIDADFSETK